jgi:ligand-binding SRPBCC domain-containing protein
VGEDAHATAGETPALRMNHVLKFEQWVPAPIEQVFRFFADPRNLSVISPPSSNVKLKSLRLLTPAINADGNERIAGVGTEIEISFRLVPYLPMRGSWTARIVGFEWLRWFRDVQVKGPFKKFEHTHSFRVEERGGVAGTVIHDYVEYEVGFGVLGDAANAIAVGRIWKQMFAYRHQATERHFATKKIGERL